MTPDANDDDSDRAPACPEDETIGPIVFAGPDKAFKIFLDRMKADIESATLLARSNLEPTPGGAEPQ